jgi:hypothetical protein
MAETGRSNAQGSPSIRGSHSELIALCAGRTFLFSSADFLRSVGANVFAYLLLHRTQAPSADAIEREREASEKIQEDDREGRVGICWLIGESE